MSGRETGSGDGERRQREPERGGRPVRRARELRARGRGNCCAAASSAPISACSPRTSSLEAAGRPGKSWREAMLALVGELKYEGPLVASGAIFLAGGPVAATIAAVIGAAVGGVAVKDLLEEVTAKPHTEDFARSLAAGSVILWVRAPDEARRARRARRAGSQRRAQRPHRPSRARADAGGSGVSKDRQVWPISARAARCASRRSRPKQQKITLSGISCSARNARTVATAMRAARSAGKP